MKINHSISNDSSILNYGYVRNRMEGGMKGKEAQIQNGSINASGLNLFEDKIANKKQKAMQDAMQFVKDQFKADGEIDAVLEDCRQRSVQSRESLKEAQQEIAIIEEEKQKLLADCPKDSEEYKAIEKEYNERQATWIEQKNNAQADIAMQTAAIRGIKQEMLKHHGMVDAENAKEMLLEEAGKEIVGMLIEEAKDKIEEDLKDTVEKGEEQKENKEELEEKLEEIQAEQKENIPEEQTERSNRTASNLLDISDKHKEILEKAEQLTEEQKMLMEELKGISIDTII